MADKILGMLGIMRKANAIAPGEENAASAVQAGKARLLVIPNDVSEKKLDRAAKYLDGHSCAMVILPYNENEISEAVGLGGCSMAAITDIGFAVSFAKKLSENNSGYNQVYSELALKEEKIRERKMRKPGKIGKK